jgi:cyclopropane fatty-acyl-phospholipid synthase-like methyltransferase
MVGPTGYWYKLQHYQLSFLKQMGLLPGHTLLDIGCGPLSGGIAFIEYLQAGRYAGIDIRQDAITEAHIQLARSGLAGKNPVLIKSDDFGEGILGGRHFDYIWACQVFYHMDEEVIRRCIRSISKRMKPGSRFFGDIIGFPNKVTDSSRWRGFSFYLHEPEMLRDIAAEQGLHMTNLGPISQFGYPETLGLKTNQMLEFSRSG